MDREYMNIINKYAKDIISNERYKSQDKYIQHGNTSVLEHEMNVTIYCLKLARKYNIKIDEVALVRGSLLHDYFLYDWHVADKSHRLHGFFHAKKAMNNAIKDFNINEKERSMISTHMFPMNLRIPKYKESMLLCISDKIVATREIISRK